MNKKPGGAVSLGMLQHEGFSAGVGMACAHDNGFSHLETTIGAHKEAGCGGNKPRRGGPPPYEPIIPNSLPHRHTFTRGPISGAASLSALALHQAGFVGGVGVRVGGCLDHRWQRERAKGPSPRTHTLLVLPRTTEYTTGQIKNKAHADAGQSQACGQI